MKKLMKRFIRWLAKIFGADITIRETVVKTIVEHLPPEGGVIEGDLMVSGNIVATGCIKATGYIACLLAECETETAGKEAKHGQQ